MRGIDRHSSLLFVVPITIEEDEPGLFGAAVDTMKDRMAASGRTPEEAADNACRLFRGMVDSSLARKVSIQFATGLQAMPLKVPISEAPKVFALLDEIDAIEEEQETNWLRLFPLGIPETEHHAD